MQAYTGFAQVYDLFMDNVPYDEWANYLSSLLKECGVNEGLVLELGCGTGNITRRLKSAGYDMIGIDYSEEMLEIARDRDIINYMDADSLECHSPYDEDLLESDSPFDEEKEEQIKSNSILYLQQDMRDFELYGTVAAVVSVCDSMNYITSDQELLQVFKLINNYLDANGFFIFDMNTEHKYKDILADNTIAENREDCSFIWENYYFEDKMINEYDVTIFVKLDNEQDIDYLETSEVENDYQENNEVERDESGDDSNQIFERLKEIHYQKAYSIDTVKKLLNEAGMEFITVYDAFTHNPPTHKSERVYFVAREKHQAHKKYV